MNRSDWLALVTLSLLWGGSFFFVEVALVGLPALSVVWGRVALATVLLGMALRLMGVAPPKPAVWPALLVMGLLNNAVPFTLFALAQGQITGSLAAILNATTPLFTVLVAHVATRDERLSRAKVAGLALGFGGVIVMMAGAEVAGDNLAKLACLGAAVSYALASVWGRRFRQIGLAPVATAFGQVAASTLLILPLWMWIDQPWLLPMPEWRVVGAMAGIAGLSTALAYLLYFRLLATAGATNVSLVTFLIPVSAMLLGVVILAERLAPLHLVGFALIAAGLMAIDGRIGRRA
jgi:drug/metabolite transporter (DMT)-like permease